MLPVQPSRTPPKFYLHDASSDSEPEERPAPQISSKPLLQVRNPDRFPPSALSGGRAASAQAPALPRLARPPQGYSTAKGTADRASLRKHPLLQGHAPNGALMTAMAHYQALRRPFFFLTDTVSGQVRCANAALAEHRNQSWDLLSYPWQVMAPLAAQVSYVQPSTNQTVHLGFVSQLLQQASTQALVPCLTAIVRTPQVGPDEQQLLAVAVAAACFAKGMLVEQDVAAAGAILEAIPPQRRHEADCVGLQYAVMQQQMPLAHYFFARGADPRFVGDEHHTCALKLALRPAHKRFLSLLLPAFTTAADLDYLADLLDHNGVHEGTQPYALLVQHIDACQRALELKDAMTTQVLPWEKTIPCAK